MEMVHKMFRREFGLVPGLLRGLADPGRARIIARHLDGITTTLHHHHHTEDQSLWPLLVHRAGMAAAAPVESMEAQHAQLADAVNSLQTRVHGSIAAPAPDAVETLAKDAQQLVWLLNEHLRAEEEQLVPLMERHITAAENQEIVAKGGALSDPESLPLVFGMMMYEADPEIIGRAVASMPVSVREAIRPLAQEAFAAHSRVIHGTPTPPRSTDIAVSDI